MVAVRTKKSRKRFSFHGLCQQSKPKLPNHSVRSRQHVRLDRQTDLLRRFEIYDKLKLRRLLYRQVGGFSASQDFVNVNGRATKNFFFLGPIERKAAIFDS